MRGRRAIAAGGAALIALVVVAAFSIARSSDESGDDALTAIDDTVGEGASRHDVWSPIRRVS